MPFPQPPSKIVQFRSGAAAPYDVERQFDEHTRAFRNLVDFLRGIIRDDGMLRNGRVGPEQLSAEIEEALAKRVLARVDGLLEAAQAETRLAGASLLEMRTLLDRIREREQMISLAALEMQRVAQEARERLDQLAALPLYPTPPSLPPPVVGALGPPYATTAAGEVAFYGMDSVDQLASTAVSSDYAQVAMTWAEWMPTTIPGNILAINGVTGDHWSSRWWANRAASMFGGAVAWMYLGAFLNTNAPSLTPTGEALQPGMLYYDTTLHQGMVWNGSAWQPLGNPQPSISSTLYYVATAGQTVFPLTTPDIYGHSYTLQVGQGVVAHMTGVRLTPDDGSGTKGDYTVSIPASTLTLVTGAPAGVVVAVDALALPSQLAPSVAKVHKLQPLSPLPDGTNAVFNLQCADGTTVNVTKPEQLLISLDGIMQEPVTAFVSAGTQITFVTAPTPDAYFFGVWLSPT